MLLARSMVSLTGHLPRMSSSSCLGAATGSASSNEAKSSSPLLPPFACVFLASALRSAMASLMLRGARAGSSLIGALVGFAGGPDLAVDWVRILEGVAVAATRDFAGVEEGLSGERG